MSHREIIVVAVVTTHRVQSALNFFMSAILICLGYSQIFELFHAFKGFITHHHAVILSSIPFMRHTHILVPSAFTSNPNYVNVTENNGYNNAD
jgi:hypothetical protein